MLEDHKKPTTWDLENKSDWELLNIARTKLDSRTRRECVKLAIVTPLKQSLSVHDTAVWKQARSKFYAHWYALEAIDIYRERQKKVTKIPTEKHEHHWHYQKTLMQHDSENDYDEEEAFIVFVCVCGRSKTVKQIWGKS
jgi:hypothetical protein